MKKSAKNSKNPSPAPKILLATALTLWVFISIVAAQLLFSLLFQFFLGDAFDQPVWSAVYSAVYYATSLALILYLPHRFPRRWPLALLVTTALLLLYYLLIFIFAISEHLDAGLLAALGQGIADFFASFTAMGIICFAIALFSLAFSIFFIISRSQASSQKIPPTSREQLGLTGLPTWTDLGLAPIAYIAALLIGAVLTALFSIFPWFDAAEAQDVGFTTLYSGLDRLVAFVALVLVAPVAEEIIFRGWLYGKLRAFLGLPAAILIVSFLFALLHGQWNVGVTVFAMSLILCLTREFTGTIYSGIVMHMLKNGLAYVLLYLVNFG